MADLRLIQQYTILKLSTIANYTPVSHNYITTNISSLSELAIRPDYCWAFDHRSMLNHSPNPNYHVLFDVD